MYIRICPSLLLGRGELCSLLAITHWAFPTTCIASSGFGSDQTLLKLPLFRLVLADMMGRGFKSGQSSSANKSANTESGGKKMGSSGKGPAANPTQGYANTPPPAKKQKKNADNDRSI